MNCLLSVRALLCDLSGLCVKRIAHAKPAKAAKENRGEDAEAEFYRCVKASAWKKTLSSRRLESMADIDFQRFRSLVLADSELQRRLRAIIDKTEFTEAVLGLANDEGFELTEEDLAEAMRAGRRAWIERWI